MVLANRDAAKIHATVYALMTTEFVSPHALRIHAKDSVDVLRQTLNVQGQTVVTPKARIRRKPEARCLVFP